MALIPSYKTPLLKAWQSSSPTNEQAPNESSSLQLLSKPVIVNPTATPAPAAPSPPDSPIAPSPGPPTEPDSPEFPHPGSPQPESPPIEQPVQEEAPEHTPTLAETHAMSTRGKHGIFKPNQRYALLASLYTTDEPKTIVSAMKHPRWNEAVMEEMERIHMLNTWSLVPMTEDMNVLDSKWVFRTKLHPDGELDKLKARLVAKGFNQEEGVDYLETFSHVVRTGTIRLVLNIATAKGWPIKQLDVSNAFLHGSDSSFLDQTLQALNKRFSMKDLGQPRYFLGIEIVSNSEGLFLHQAAYAADILHQAAMTDCNPMPSPLPQNLDNLNSELFSEPTYFRSLAGKLQYLTITRPDIQFAVNFVCQKMHSPTVADFTLLKRILRLQSNSPFDYWFLFAAWTKSHLMVCKETTHRLSLLH
ncbi:hypothetical protein AALP_AA4G141700 [Arabis alpina]|uniref:Reverse transcriptase Ty1/copia-type domain-containing protein n=1 Tax=Arabis alpina TaxID=50452 RepID=A0A087H376_ARAAL|nr:hypothetical protein AALP_AA4G141700 [Arabis alpina]